MIDGDAGQPAEQDWKIGGQDGIHASDLVLLHLEQVSRGSWQVQLQLLHPRGVQGPDVTKGVADDTEPYGLHAIRED